MDRSHSIYTRRPWLVLFLIFLIALQACSFRPGWLTPSPAAPGIATPRQAAPVASPRPPEATKTPAPTATPTAAPTAAPPTGLAGLAAARPIWIGAAVEADYLQIPEYTRLLLQEFNSVTPEIAMKWEVIHPERGRYDFTRADAIVAFAEEHGLRVRGHPLVWDMQLPAWVTEGQFTRNDWLDILHDHITTLVSRFRGRVHSWDVVNEAFDDDGLLRDTIWMRVIGPEYIALAFRWAHEADPQALLYYNDNGGEQLNRKSQGIYALASGLRRAGVPIHGVGLQMHQYLSNPFSASDLAENIHRLGELGLQVEITEMDVRIQYVEGSNQERFEGQAQRYLEIFSACWEAPNCMGFTTWGLTDAYSWVRHATERYEAALIFDVEYRPKPAYRRIEDFLMSGR